MATVPGTPSNLDSLNASALRKIAWDSKLRVDSVRPSVLTQLKTEFRISDMGEIIITKPGILLDITNVGKSQQGQSVRCALRTPLKKRARYGVGENLLGNEDETDLLWCQLYYNEIKKAVKFYQYGYYFNDTEFLNYNAGYQSLLSQFHAENDDSRMQQALMLTYAEELIFSPVSATRQFNKNWCIPNLSEANFPAWDLTAVTKTDGAADSDLYYSSRTYSGAASFVENIATALLSASGTGSTPNAIFNVDTLSHISNYIIKNHVVTPIMIDGVPSYILKIATPVKSWTMNPNNSGSLAAYTQNVADYKDPKRHTIVGEIGRIFEQFIVVHDTRCPTLTVAGAAGSRTLQPGFLQPGNNDDRNNNAWSNTSGSTNYVFDMCCVLGLNALARYRRDEMQSGLSEETEYGKIKGSGTYKGEGIQIPMYDKDDAGQTTSTAIQRGSCLIPVSRREVFTAVS